MYVYTKRGDLGFLYLFPNLKYLKIECMTITKLSLQGIENCPVLKTLTLANIVRPFKMNGIEFCKHLREFRVFRQVKREYDGDPLDITPFSHLPRLKVLYIDTSISIQAEGLDVSDCGLLEELMARPINKKNDPVGENIDQD